MNLTRRAMFKTTVAALVAGAWRPRFRAADAVEELKVPDNVPTDKFDFEAKGIEGWTTVDGQWAVEEMAGAPSGKKVLVQRAARNEFNVIVAPPGPYTDVDVSLKFKPISGKEDASGGIVLRFTDSKYYVVRANALENNFRLYYYDRGRRQLASASVQAPALGQWHTVRVVAVGDHIQAWLDGKLYLDHHDRRFRSGRVGLWTKADSVAAFDDVTVKGVAVKAGFALGSYAAFKQIGEHAMVMGDLVLLDQEIPAVMSGLFAGGLEVTAVHNHLNEMSPHMMYMHYSGHGDALQMARALRQALSASGTPLGGPAPASPPPGRPTLDTKAIEQALGRSGRDVGAGVFQVTVPRP